MMKFERLGKVIGSTPVAEKLSNLMLTERREVWSISPSQKDPKVLDVGFTYGGDSTRVTFSEPLKSVSFSLSRPFHGFKPDRFYPTAATVILEREFSQELLPQLERVFQYALTDDQLTALRAWVFKGAKTKEVAGLLNKSTSWTLNMIRLSFERIAEVTWAEVVASEGQVPIMRVPEFQGLSLTGSLWKLGVRTLQQAATLDRDKARALLGERSFVHLGETLPRYGLALAGYAEQVALATAVEVETRAFRAQMERAVQRLSRRCHVGKAEARAALLKGLSGVCGALYTRRRRP